MVKGNVDVEKLLGTGLYDVNAARQLSGWAEEMAGGHTPETEEYGIGSVVFRSDRPFHPARLAQAIEALHGIVRSKGFCWIASRCEMAAIWSQAGPNLFIEGAGPWTGTDEKPGQELVFIGVHLDKTAPQRLLSAALLTDEELAAGPRAWVDFPDPLPRWAMPHAHA